MSLTKKGVTTYSKSLFQNILETKNASKHFDLTNVSTPLTLEQAKKFTPDISIIGEELYLLSSALTTSIKVKKIFNNPTYAEQQKLEVLFIIFPGLSLTTKSFLKVLTERSHLNLLPEINIEYTKLLNNFNEICNVKIITSSTLKPNYGNMLLTTLKNLTTTENIILNVSYNPKLLGGLILEYKSNSIDASLLKEFSLFFTEI